MSETPLHICMVVRALPRHRLGGLEFHTLDLSIALTELGHKVSIVTTEFDAENRFPQLDETCMTENFAIYCIPGTRPGDYSLAFWNRLPDFLRDLHTQSPFDVVHFQDFAGLFLARIFPLPFVVTVHGTMFSEVPLDYRYRSRLSLPEKVKALWKYKPRLILNYFFRRMLADSPVLITDSEFTKNELLRTNPLLEEKIQVVPLGIDFRRYPAPSDKDLVFSLPSSKPLRIILIGRLQKIKGIFIALEAAKLLLAAGIPFHMTIGGTGPDKETAEQFTQENGLAEKVTFPGRIAPEEFGTFLESGDVFLFPDLTQPAFGLVALEAMHYGIPVIGAKSGAILEVIQDAGWLYEPWDAEALARLITDISKNPVERAEKAHIAKERAAVITTHVMAQNTVSAYRTAISRKR